MIAEEKNCRVCGEFYPRDHFSPRHKGKEDRVNICRDCASAQQIEARNEQRELRKGNVYRSFSPEDPWGDLACAVIRQAVLDWKAVRRMKRPKYAMVAFFNSGWFEELCGIAGYDPEWLREKLGVT